MYDIPFIHIRLLNILTHHDI